MRGSKEDLPTVTEGEGFVSRQAEWGEMNVAIENVPEGLDAEPFFKGLPDNRCQCPHWGYIIKGRIWVRYPDREEGLLGREPRQQPHHRRDDQEVERQHGGHVAPVGERPSKLPEGHLQEGHVEQYPEYGVDEDLQRRSQRGQREPERRAE